MGSKLKQGMGGNIFDIQTSHIQMTFKNNSLKSQFIPIEFGFGIFG